MDERSSKREVVDLEVDAIRAGESFRALVYDLSVDGCMIATDGEPALSAGDAIQLDLPFVGATEGTIIWVRGSMCGAQFTHHLHDAVTRQLGFRPRADRRVDLLDQFGRSVTKFARPFGL